MPTYEHNGSRFEMSSLRKDAQADLVAVMRDGDWITDHGICPWDVVDLELDAESAWSAGGYAHGKGEVTE